MRLRMRPPPPLPHPYDVRAQRRPGDRIRVTWRTDVASPQAGFAVIGEARRGGPVLAIDAIVIPRHRRRFALTLHHARGVRLLTLYTFAGFSRHRQVVPVR